MSDRKTSAGFMIPALIPALALVLLGGLSPEILAQTTRPISVTPQCAQCELNTDETFRISSRVEEVGPLDRTWASAVDPSGRVWVSFGMGFAPQVFSSDGQLIREVGRIGQGPNEFMGATGLVPVLDSMAVFDAGNSRVTIFSPDLEPVRSFELRGQVIAGVAMAWPRVAVNAIIPTPAEAGHPFHIINLDTGAIEESFGGREHGNITLQDQHLMIGRIAFDEASGELWTTPRIQINLQRWSASGELLGTFTGLDWIPADARGRMGSRNTSPDPTVASLFVTDEGIWMAFQFIRPDWRRAWENVAESTDPHGGAIVDLPPPDDLFQGKIVLLDPARGELINIWDLGHAALGPAAPGFQGGFMALEDLGGVYPSLVVMQVRSGRFPD